MEGEGEREEPHNGAIINAVSDFAVLPTIADRDAGPPRLAGDIRPHP